MQAVAALLSALEALIDEIENDKLSKTHLHGLKSKRSSSASLRFRLASRA